MPAAAQDFAQCLRELLQKKKVSASELARMMAYRSRNSIFRILDGACAHGTRLAFFERLKEENPLGLDEAEFEQLWEALEISRVGADVYRSNLAMRDLLTGGGKETAPLRVIDSGGQEGAQVLARFRHARRMEIVITGCCDRGILAAMRRQLGEMSETCAVRVTHFIYAGQEELVRAVSAIQPMLYAGFYEAYSIEPGVFSKEREQFYRVNCIYVHWEDADGKEYVQPFVLADQALFYAMKQMKTREYGMLYRLFEDDRTRMKAIKSVFPLDADQPDYVAFTDMCRRLEQGRTIYTVKLDVPFPFISTDILVPCALESFVAAGVEPKEAQALVEPLRAVHARRYENIFSKRKPTHTILSLPFMERFARTGKQTDHFFALRPYTGAERAAILSHIREQAVSNPQFNMYFFKDGFEPPLMEIALYEGAGTLMNKPFTDYNLAGDHAEAIVTNAEFCERYKAYFVEDLLARQVMGQQETLDALDKMIEIARHS